MLIFAVISGWVAKTKSTFKRKLAIQQVNKVQKLFFYGFSRGALLRLVKINNGGTAPIVDKKILTANVIVQDTDLVDLLQDREVIFSIVILAISNGQRTKNRPYVR